MVQLKKGDRAVKFSNYLSMVSAPDNKENTYHDCFVQLNKQNIKRCIHCDGVPAESVEYVGGACEIQNQLFWARMCHIFNLSNKRQFLNKV